MSAEIGISGFGRIGRHVLWETHGTPYIKFPGFEGAVRGIKNRTDLAKYSHVIGRDTKYRGVALLEDFEVYSEQGILRVGENQIPYEQFTIGAGQDHKFRWDDVGARIVVESTGVVKDTESAQTHLDAGASLVVISTDAKKVPMFVFGVNHEKFDPKK